MTKLFISVEFVLSFELIRMLKLYIHIASFCKKILPLQKNIQNYGNCIQCKKT